MSHFRGKRPSSARRHIKQETFSSFASRGRLSFVQSLLSDEEKNEDDSADAVLCILGIDGRFNDGCREFANYLLFGFFENRRIEIERSGFPEDTVDDMVFCIQKDDVDVYCNPINYHYLLPYIAHWPNLHIHCLQEDAYKDEEKAEEFKIRSLVAMVEGCHSVGIPYSTAGNPMKFDKMIFEKWPIIQAYALEDVGGGGFFTLMHPVIDMTSRLQKLYHLMDPVSLETLLMEKLPLFEMQCTSMLEVLDIERGERLLTDTEASVCEALTSYYHHGKVRNSTKLDRDAAEKSPYVLFGTHSSRKYISEGSSAVSSDLTISQAGVNHKPATHMVYSAVSARSPLSCARTYFFHTGFVPYSVSEATQTCERSSLSDVKYLQTLYFACVTAVHAAIREYADTLSPSQAHHKVMQTFADYIVDHSLPHAEHFRKRNIIDFKIEAFNNFNCRTVLEEGQWLPQVKTASVAVYDIPSLDHQGSTLGSVIFTEAFIESSINVQKPDGSTHLDGSYLILTSYIPTFVNFPPLEKNYLNVLERCIKDDCCDKLGDVISTDHSVAMFSDLTQHVPQSTKILHGVVHWFEEGFIHIHPHCGPVIVPRHMLHKIELYDGDSSSQVVLLIVYYKEELRRNLPVHYALSTSQLILAFMPKSKAYKALFGEVLPQWKQWAEDDGVLEQIEELPDHLETLHQRLQSQYTSSQRKSISAISTENRANLTPSQIKPFLDHFSYSSHTEKPIPGRHLLAVKGLSYDGGSFGDTEELMVTVLGGLPGSGKDVLCKSLIRLARESSNWAVLQQPADSSDVFTPDQLQASLAAIWRSHRKRQPGVTAKTMRVLLVVPGFTDTVSVVQAITCHPDKEICSHLNIGAVTICLNPDNALMRDNYCLPKLLDQCAHGWVNNIVFTSPSQSTTLDDMQHLVKSCNPDVALLLAEHGEITRSPDIDLIMADSAFNEASFIRARYLSCPGWWQGSYKASPSKPAMTEVNFKFTQPLEKKRFVTRLKLLKNSHAGHPFDGNVYHVKGIVRIVESDRPQEVTYTVLPQQLSITPGEHKPAPPSARGTGEPPNQTSLTFTGCGLNRDKLQQWLRTCAPQKPERKLNRMRSSLTRAEIERIHKQQHLEPLPDGWFYNGSQYVSLDGEKSSTHPELESFIDNYLRKVNREVEEYNSRISQQAFHDLFEE